MFFAATLYLIPVIDRINNSSHSQIHPNCITQRSHKLYYTTYIYKSFTLGYFFLLYIYVYIQKSPYLFFIWIYCFLCIFVRKYNIIKEKKILLYNIAFYILNIYFFLHAYLWKIVKCDILFCYKLFIKSIDSISWIWNKIT